MKTNTHSKTNTTSAQSAKAIRGGLLLAVLIVKKIIIPISTFSVNGLIDMVSRFQIVLLTSLSLFLLNVSATTAQTLQWQKQYNGPASQLDEAAKVKTDASGNVYVTGTSQADILTVKYNAAGVQQWTKRYNKTYVDYYDATHSTIDKATDLQIDGSGNIYVTGYVYYDDFDFPSLQIVTIKYNSSGILLWEKTSTYLTTKPEDIQDPRAFIDATGNIYTVVSYSSSVDGEGISLGKLSNAGSTIWTRTYEIPVYIKVTANAIHVDGSGNVYVAGSVNQMNGNYLTLKYNNAGTLQWQRQYNGPVGGKDEAVKVKTDPAGNVYVTGTSVGELAFKTNDIVTVKYNASGVQQWAVRHNTPFFSDEVGAHNTDEKATDLQVDAGGNTYVSGASYYSQNAQKVEVITIKYNTSGVKQWQLTNATVYLTDLSRVDGPHSAFDGSGLFVTAAYQGGDDSSRKIIVEKISLVGTIFWERSFTAMGGYNISSHAIHVDSPGNVYITGKIDQNNGNYLTLKYAAQQTVRINSGGPVLRTSLGSFSADAYLTGSSSSNSSANAIAGTTDDALYQTYRWANVAGGSFGYNIPLVNGRYTVKLHFVETFYTTANKRKFNVTAEGATWLSNYDIAADGGVNTAKVKSKIITITDGYLTLNFKSVLDNAVVSAVELIPAPASSARESAEGAEEEIKAEIAPEELTSLQAYPNPFTDKITFSFTVLQNSPVRLEVYDLQGTLVEGLFNEEAETGRRYDIEWKAAHHPAGMYVVRLATGSSVSTKKVVLVK